LQLGCKVTKNADWVQCDFGERLGFAFGVLIDEENHEKEGYAVYSIRNDESRNQDKSIGIFSK
jgi:hypothetical protein